MKLYEQTAWEISVNHKPKGATYFKDQIVRITMSLERKPVTKDTATKIYTAIRKLYPAPEHNVCMNSQTWFSEKDEL